MLAEVTAGLGSLKAAFDITKGLNAANTQASVNEVRIELQQLIIDAQQALSAASDIQTANAQRMRQLEQEIVQLKDKSAELQRYELAKTGEEGGLAYRLKDERQSPELPHWICPNCYEDGKKSLMQHDHLPQGRCEVLSCHPCGNEIVFSGRRVTPQKSSTFGRR